MERQEDSLPGNVLPDSGADGFLKHFASDLPLFHSLYPPVHKAFSIARRNTTNFSFCSFPFAGIDNERMLRSKEYFYYE